MSFVKFTVAVIHCFVCCRIVKTILVFNLTFKNCEKQQKCGSLIASVWKKMDWLFKMDFLQLTGQKTLTYTFKPHTNHVLPYQWSFSTPSTFLFTFKSTKLLQQKAISRAFTSCTSRLINLNDCKSQQPIRYSKLTYLLKKYKIYLYLKTKSRVVLQLNWTCEAWKWRKSGKEGFSTNENNSSLLIDWSVHIGVQSLVKWNEMWNVTQWLREFVCPLALPTYLLICHFLLPSCSSLT